MLMDDPVLSKNCGKLLLSGDKKRWRMRITFADALLGQIRVHTNRVVKLLIGMNGCGLQGYLFLPIPRACGVHKGWRCCVAGFQTPLHTTPPPFVSQRRHA